MEQLNNETISPAGGVVISEWLPNPRGRDSEHEWLELYNSGDTAQPIDGWRLTTGGRSEHTLSGTLVPGEYLLVSREESKLPLRNKAGELFLYNNQGMLVHKAGFPGTAPEGKTFSLLDGTFLFTEPTPSEKNVLVEQPLLANTHTAGTALRQSISGGEVLAMMLGAGLVIAGLVLYITLHNDTLSHYFLSRGDEKISL